MSNITVLATHHTIATNLEQGKQVSPRVQNVGVSAVQRKVR